MLGISLLQVFFNAKTWTTHKPLCLNLGCVFVLQDMRGPQALEKAVRGEECEEEDEEEEEEDVELVGGMTTAESDKSDEEEEEEVNKKKQEKPEWDSSCTTY